MAPKRKCKFTEDLIKLYLFIKKTKLVHYDICKSQFSISSSRKTDITRHIGSEKHKKYLHLSASSSKLNEYFRKTEFLSKEKELAASEVLWLSLPRPWA